MRISKVRIQNFKAAKDLEVALSSFACFIGENNAGKSTVLQAISLFLSPRKFGIEYFYRTDAPVDVTLTFSEVSASDLLSLSADAQEKFKLLIKKGEIEITRRFNTDGTNEIGTLRLLPKSDVFKRSALDKTFERKSGAAAIRTVVAEQFPQYLDGLPSGIASQSAAKAYIVERAIADASVEKCTDLDPFPTGASFSIKPFLPEDIYIPAVKDLSDEVGVKQGSSFGKVLGILMDRISRKLTDEHGLLFDKLRKYLAVVDGVDDRLQEIRDVESVVGALVKESFPGVRFELDIQPPAVKTLLDTAKVFLDDGVKGVVDTKGDGLKRAVVFAILRAYVQLSVKDSGQGGVAGSKNKYILLFEEPELFLHPDAQRVLFEALQLFSKSSQVLLTTHSPVFVSVGAASFIKITKQAAAGDPKPITSAQVIDLSDLTSKDELQIVSFENNNAAIFSKKVVLVEGDSEVIVMPHMAKTINPKWDSGLNSVSFVQVRGKGNIQRYKDFFRRFGTPVYIIVDLDVLVDGIKKLSPSLEVMKLHKELHDKINKYVIPSGFTGSAKDVKDFLKRGDAKKAWIQVEALKQDFDSLPSDHNRIAALMDGLKSLFDWQWDDQRLKILRDRSLVDVECAIHDLLAELRISNVFILRNGAIEAYYPTIVPAADKVSRAHDYCQKVTDAKLALSTSHDLKGVFPDGIRSEMHVVLNTIFS